MDVIKAILVMIIITLWFIRLDLMAIQDELKLNRELLHKQQTNNREG